MNIQNESGKEVSRESEHWNQPRQTFSQNPLSPEQLKEANNKKILAGILAILLGHLGIHKFVLGYNNEGIILIVLAAIGYATACIVIGGVILSVTGIIGLIEGIIYLTKSDEDFYNTYIANKKSWF